LGKRAGGKKQVRDNNENGLTQSHAASPLVRGFCGSLSVYAGESRSVSIRCRRRIN
jgi:hypothetical protein